MTQTSFARTWLLLRREEWLCRIRFELFEVSGAIVEVREFAPALDFKVLDYFVWLVTTRKVYSSVEVLPALIVSLSYYFKGALDIVVHIRGNFGLLN